MVDEKLLGEANEIFARLGMDYDQAMELFLRHVVTKGAMPFGEYLIGPLTREDAIIALSDPFFRIYYIDLETEDFVRFSRSVDDPDKIERYESGDFFTWFSARGEHIVHPDDKETFAHFSSKQSWVNTHSTSAITLTYRSLEFGAMHYHTLRGVKMNEHYLVLGMAFADEQRQKEKMLKNQVRKANVQANVDGLTGLYNQRAFGRVSRRLRNQISEGKAKRFTVVVCDLNDLKYINDTKGHLAGDRALQATAEKLSTAFTPWRVYRLGGDEFAVIVDEGHHEKCEKIVASLQKDSAASAKAGRPSVAIGMVTYNPDEDKDYSSVFFRADMAMYENKKELKTLKFLAKGR